MQPFLDDFAKEHATEGKRLVLVWDGASAQGANSLRVPGRISLIRVLADTPELNPGESVWPLIKEGVANQARESLGELEQQVCSRCQKINADGVSALTNYHWWPKR